MLVGLLGCRYTSGRAESAPLRRTGAQTGRATMAEANSLEDDAGPTHLDALEPIMPHLKHKDRAEMDRLYPPIVAADALDDDGEAEADEDDVIFQHGLEIVEGIREKLVSDGRRRRVVVDE